MVHPLGSAPLGEPHGEHGGADFTSSKHSWDVCRTSHRPQQTPVKTGCPRDPTVSPRQGGSQPMPLAPSVSGGGGGGGGGGQGSAWSCTLLPSGRWSLLSPQLCVEHRLCYPLPWPSQQSSLRGESPGDPSPPPPDCGLTRSPPTALTPLEPEPSVHHPGRGRCPCLRAGRKQRYLQKNRHAGKSGRSLGIHRQRDRYGPLQNVPSGTKFGLLPHQRNPGRPGSDL